MSPDLIGQDRAAESAFGLTREWVPPFLVLEAGVGVFPKVRRVMEGPGQEASLCFPLVSFYGSVPLGAWTINSHLSVEKAFCPEIRLGGAVGQSVGVRCLAGFCARGARGGRGELRVFPDLVD